MTDFIHNQDPAQNKNRKMINSNNSRTFWWRLYDRFFKPRFPEGDYKIQGLGSGIIIDSEKGYIITNNHVVEDADELKINLGDKREFDGR